MVEQNLKSGRLSRLMPISDCPIEGRRRKFLLIVSVLIHNFGALTEYCRIGFDYAV
jgi:hypothetical protein